MKRELTLTLDGTAYKVVVDGNSILVNGQPFVVSLEGERILVDDTPYDVKLEANATQAVVGGIAYSLGVEGLEAEAGKAAPRAGRLAAASAGAVTAIMPGKIIRVLVAPGDRVAEGDVICILEAMKMENELKAPKAGTVETLRARPGQDVERGAVLAEIK
jgi:biotin carboxyl carrier protein